MLSYSGVNRKVPNRGQMRVFSDGQIRNEITFPRVQKQKNVENRLKKSTFHKMVLQNGTRPKENQVFPEEIRTPGERRYLPTVPHVDTPGGIRWASLSSKTISEKPGPLPQIIIDVIVAAILPGAGFYLTGHQLLELPEGLPSGIIIIQVAE